MFGFTENYVRVGVKYDPLAINEMKLINITGVDAELIATAEEVTDLMVQPSHHEVQ